MWAATKGMRRTSGRPLSKCKVRSAPNISFKPSRAKQALCSPAAHFRAAFARPA
jgi:hypothetical protein